MQSFNGKYQVIRGQAQMIQKLIDTGFTQITFVLLYDSEEPMIRKLCMLERGRVIPNPERIGILAPYGDLEELLVELTYDGPSGFYLVDLVGLEVFRLGTAELVEQIDITPLIKPEKIHTLQLEAVPDA